MLPCCRRRSLADVDTDVWFRDSWAAMWLERPQSQRTMFQWDLEVRAMRPGPRGRAVPDAADFDLTIGGMQRRYIVVWRMWRMWRVVADVAGCGGYVVSVVCGGREQTGEV